MSAPLTGAVPLAIVRYGPVVVPTPYAISSVQLSRLLSAIVASIGAAVVRNAPCVSGRNATTGAPVSAGSRVFSTAVACPVVPSTSVATASKLMRPGTVGVMTAMPFASSGTITPSRYSTTLAMDARPAATGCTVTAWPGTVVNDGVSSIRTDGAGGVSAARSTIVCVMLSSPSLTLNTGV